ncbi:putative virus X resistance protein-like, coiled-coil [Dioscorea sansibarensis]
MAGAIVFSIMRWMISHGDPALPFKKPSLTQEDATKSDQLEPSSFQEDMAKLEKTLLKIQTVLTDAEEREIKEESVKLWLRELKDVAYDAEDVLHEYEYELLQARLNPVGKRKREEKSSKSITCNDRIKDIRMRLEEIEKEREALRLREDDGERRFDAIMQPLPTTELVDESTVYGREDDVDKLVEMVIGEGSYSVIPLVGMGGIGKTTLARLVLKDPRIGRYFNSKVWLSVPMDFKVVKMMQGMIQSITGESCELTELSALQDVLKEELKGKRLLLVLDDVWNENLSLWDCFQAGLMGKGQRKIIVTTRNESVAKIIQTVSPYRLSCLDEDHCWLLFKKYAFDVQDPEIKSPNLVEIGKKIVEKCGGLPLAVKTLGSLLAYEVSEDRWEDVLVSDLWDLDEGDDNILPALKVSYHRMPAHLKPCFTYCSLFPKNYMFKKDQMIRLWMAQGLIQNEDIGRRCFDDLLRRSFFQHSQVDEDELPLYRSQLGLSQVGREELLQKWFFILTNNREDETFLMHDLVHDLAQSIAGKECCMFEEVKAQEMDKKTRHLSLIAEDPKTKASFQAFHELKFLRTFLHVNTKMHTWNGGGITEASLLSIKIPNDLFMKLVCLRAIDFSFSRIEELPETIDQLKHLCHLGLQACIIKRLPESISNLYFLQTLDLKYCKSLQKLPKGIVRLFNLRHLELPTKNLESLVSIPSGIGKLTNLQTLTAINIRRGKEGCSIGELKELVNLRGHLGMGGIQNVSKAKDAREANLKNKEHLQTLALIWDATGSNTVQEFVANGVFESLQPHTNLKQLLIRGFNGDRFPSWLGDPSFSGLTSIALSNCSECTRLPPLGQLPFLEDLLIGKMKSIQYIGPEIRGHCDASSKAFPALKYIDFEEMAKLEVWEGVLDGDFPTLKRIVIKHCPNLKALPQDSPSLEILEMQDVEMLCSMPNFSSLKGLDLQGKWSDKLLSLTPSFHNLHSLEISWSENLTILQLPEGLNAIKNLEVGDCPELIRVLGLLQLKSLESLVLHALPKLEFSHDDWLPSTLQSLHVTSCTELSWLPLHQHMSSLKQLQIANCPEIQDLEGLQHLFYIENLEISDCDKLLLPLDMALPSSLKFFKLCSCNNLKSIPVFHENLSELHELVIEDCERLSSVTGLHNLTSLKALEINNCRDLRLSSSEALPSSTLEVEVVDCPGLIDWCESHGIKHTQTEDWELGEHGEGDDEEEDEEEKWFELGTDNEIE